jgi:hypothetical protein
MASYVPKRTEYQRKRNALLAAYPELPKIQEEWERKTLAASQRKSIPNAFHV